MIRKLAVEFDDAQIARVLSKQGRRTGEGNVFTAHRVATHRNRHGIPNCPKPIATDSKEGPFTADEAAAELSVGASTIHRWLRDGVLPGRQVAAGAPWRIRLTDELRQKLKSGAAPSGWLGLTDAARRLGLSKARVAQLVRSGKLKAVRSVVGKRQCWRIDVSSADCAKQRDLLDRMNSGVSKEA
jgi:excisionase family DNA binding protein